MEQIVNGKLYDTDKATLVASDRYFDGSNFDRHGRNTYLYKTKKGAFFVHHSTLWQGELDSIEPCTEAEAKVYFERLPENEISYFEAFGTEPEEA